LQIGTWREQTVNQNISENIHVAADVSTAARKGASGLTLVSFNRIFFFHLTHQCYTLSYLQALNYVWFSAASKQEEPLWVRQNLRRSAEEDVPRASL